MGTGTDGEGEGAELGEVANAAVDGDAGDFLDSQGGGEEAAEHRRQWDCGLQYKSSGEQSLTSGFVAARRLALGPRWPRHYHHSPSWTEVDLQPNTPS